MNIRDTNRIELFILSGKVERVPKSKFDVAITLSASKHSEHSRADVATHNTVAVVVQTVANNPAAKPTSRTSLPGATNSAKYSR